MLFILVVNIFPTRVKTNGLRDFVIHGATAGNKREREELSGNSLHPSSSLWSPQSLSPSHCHWAGMQVHSPNALTAHVKWFLPHKHSALPRAPAHRTGREG